MTGVIVDHEFKPGKFQPDVCLVQLARYPCARPRSEHRAPCEVGPDAVVATPPDGEAKASFACSCGHTNPDDCPFDDERRA